MADVNYEKYIQISSTEQTTTSSYTFTFVATFDTPIGDLSVNLVTQASRSGEQPVTLFTDTISLNFSGYSATETYLDQILESLLQKPYLEPPPLPSYSFQLGDAISIQLGQAVEPQ